jgi:hypothetical protein
MFRFLSRLFSGTRTGTRTASPTCRPTLEALEERALLSGYSFVPAYMNEPYYNYGSFSCNVGGNFGPFGGSLGTDGPAYNFGAGPVSYSPATSTLGFNAPFGSLNFGPDSTQFCAGPSYNFSPYVSASAQACYAYPYGYNNFVNDAADYMSPVLGPLDDPNAMSTFADPFGTSMGFDY